MTRSPDDLAADVRTGFSYPDPNDHHRLCAIRRKKACDCYARRAARHHAALDELVGRLREAEARVQELERENERLSGWFEETTEILAQEERRSQHLEAAEAALAERTEQRDRVGKIAAEEAVARSKSEIALADMRRALEEAGGTLPDPMHPAFPPEFVDKQAAALAIIDRALAATEGTAPSEGEA